MFHKFRVSKNDRGERGLVFTIFQPPLRFSVEIVLPHSTETFRKRPFCAVFQKKTGSEKFLPDRGLSRFSIKKFLVSQC